MTHLSEIHCITTQPMCKGQKSGPHKGGKRVLKYSLDGKLIEQFSSVITAATDANLSPGRFRRNLREGRGVIRGFRWELA